ncbi:MAG TPA: NAD(P)H-dependent oxidoreductase [Deltaproteobacteria bacterium]|jgi:FMN-dependent NADH-azoreductase/putative sterol carrier protein|nr:NAD(P)H-dependent oxidoreductase [Deltaproteobacteria bacterium]HOI07425.1 NAD(P)H-dependent oxidoreductase [Deltaproteobacteria bacterium]
MKVLAVDSSPRKDGHSKVRLMLDALVEGMREAGAHVDVVRLKDKKIRYCVGCLHCWTKTPGVCSIKDDMSAELFPLWLEADLVVHATPLYHFTVNAAMKAFIERTLPVLQPFLIRYGEETVHPLRHRHPNMAFLSVAGFPEMSAFDQLSSWARFIYGRVGILKAEIYRPNAEVLLLPALKRRAAEVFEATRQAGRELVLQGKVSDETMAGITRDLITDKKLFHEVSNIMWKTCIKQCVNPVELNDRNIFPVPETIGEFQKIMRFGFNPKAAQGMKAVVQFDFTGSCEGSCHFIFDDGKIQGSDGPAASPDVTIATDFDLWTDIMAKKADGQQCFLEGKFTAQGDLNLLIRMNELFGG